MRAAVCTLALVALATGCGQVIHPWNPDAGFGLLASVSPDAGVTGPGGRIDFTVALEHAYGSEVQVVVTVDPSSLGTVPSPLVIPAGETEGTLAFTAGSGRGSGKVTFAATNTLEASVGVAGLVISELSAEGPGSDAYDEFVELYNPTSQPIALGGFRLDYASAPSGAWNTLHTFGSTVSIPAHGFYLVGGSTFAGEDVQASEAPTVSMSKTGGNLRLMDGSLVVDRLSWGSGSLGEGAAASAPPAGSSVERKANAASTEASMTSGADATRGNGQDTDDNAADFVLRTTRNPQASSATPEAP